MKKIIALILAAMMLLSMAACAPAEPAQGGETGAATNAGEAKEIIKTFLEESED